MKVVKLNKHTNILINLAIKIAKTASDYQKDYFIGGGLAIDFSVGKITRNHHDIDFHPMLQDSLWWKRWFENQGYKVLDKVDPHFTEVFKVKDKDDNTIVDMWPFKLVNGKLLIKYQGEYLDSGRYWEETRKVNFQNTIIRIENPQRVLDQKIRHAKKGQALRPPDIHDFKLLGRNPKGD
ncbi:MAG: hypothetical protein Q8N84_02380 [bacterium]|nr:hypothetical protein [bacterium]